MKASYLNLCRPVRGWGAKKPGGSPGCTVGTMPGPAAPCKRLLHRCYSLYSRMPENVNIQRCTAREKGRAGGQEEVSQYALWHISLPRVYMRRGFINIAPSDAGGGNRTHLCHRADDGDCCPLQQQYHARMLKNVAMGTYFYKPPGVICRYDNLSRLQHGQSRRGEVLHGMRDAVTAEKDVR